MLEVTNGTPESTGIYRSFLLPVPADSRTAYSARCWQEAWAKQGVTVSSAPHPLPKWDCKAAAAWTYGLLPNEYQVGVRT